MGKWGMTDKCKWSKDPYDGFDDNIGLKKNKSLERSSVLRPCPYGLAF